MNEEIETLENKLDEAYNIIEEYKLENIRLQERINQIETKIDKTFYVPAEVWNLENGVITAVKYNNQIFCFFENDNKPDKVEKKILEEIENQPENENTIDEIELVKKTSYRKKPRTIETWILKNDIIEFTPEDFLAGRGKYPRCRLDKTISNMIDEGKLLQFPNNVFKVTTKFKDLIP